MLETAIKNQTGDPDTTGRPGGRLLRGEEVAQILNCSRAYAFRLMQRGKIPTVKIGRSVRVRPQDLDQFILSSIES